MIQFCTSIESSRLRYTVEQFFSPISVRWVSQQAEVDAAIPVIYYGSIPEGFSISLSPRKWYEKGFRYPHNSGAIFPTNTKEWADVDWLEILFYLYARVDEYGSPSMDTHGRIEPQNLVQSRWQGVQQPYIELWREQVFKTLGIEDRYVCIQELTIDVDSAFAYRHKGFKRTLGGFVKDVLRGEWSNARERLLVLLKSQADRFDTYDYLEQCQEQSKWPLKMFFLLADASRHNIGLDYRQRRFRELIQRMAGRVEVGIHPGYHDNESERHTRIELTRLQEIVGRPVTISRQHFLKMSMPETYRALHSMGIQADYTMGFAQTVGYRAGTSRPFFWYDYERDEKTELLIVPFWGMDTVIVRHMGWQPSDAMEHMEQAMQEVAGLGDWRMIWHNETVSDEREWAGWKAVFEYQFKRKNA